MSTESAARNIIGQGTVIRGNIELNGDFRIDGQLTGSITSSGRIVIGASGIVDGNVDCQNADISGQLKGNLKSSDLTSLKSTAMFEGELKTGRISIEVGAKFNGKCEMHETEKK